MPFAYSYQTTPYAPCPMGFMSLYFASTSNLDPPTEKVVNSKPLEVE